MGVFLFTWCVGVTLLVSKFLSEGIAPCLAVCLVGEMSSEGFYVTTLLLISNFILFIWKRYLDIWYVLIFLNILRFLLWPIILSVWRIFHVYLRKMCILLLSNRIFYICLVFPFDLKYSSSPMFSCSFSSWMIFSFLKNGILALIAIIVLCSISPHQIY